MSAKKVRVLLAKPGLDGHDRGVKTVAYALRDAGFDVIYSGLHQTPEQVVALAIEKKAHVIGLSILSGAHLPICTEVVAQLKQAGLGDLPLMVGGVIPERDIPALQAMGIKGIFPVDTPYEAIVAFIEEQTDGR